MNESGNNNNSPRPTKSILSDQNIEKDKYGIIMSIIIMRVVLDFFFSFQRLLYLLITPMIERKERIEYL